MRDGVTGLLFSEPTPDALGNALVAARERQWDAAALRAHAESFAEAVFVARFTEAVANAVARNETGLDAPDDVRDR